MVAGLLLFWFVLPAPLTLIESFHAPLPAGILDGDEDDDAIAALSNLDSKLVAMISSPPREVLQAVARATHVETSYRATFAVILATTSRSPPIP